MRKSQELVVASLGQCQYASPLNERSTVSKDARYFVSDSDRVRLDVVLRPGPIDADPLSLEMARPRQHIFFRPEQTTAAIVTCGGLPPGLNNVVRSLFCEIYENYGVSRVLGIRNGYLGLNPESGLEPIALTKEIVEPIDKLGGAVLGSSRGGQSPDVMADFLQAHGIDICFAWAATARSAVRMR